ncbi:putative bifunctional diguanylate cyclase/phosphodiesterase [Thiosocius teredinicola]|uniref:putative bifunctional diguanylate cyclase/phosphodiesterase n=1 Tax=Thiosocius teredinicola TaxID=1973002 RepID=UPI0013DE38DF
MEQLLQLQRDVLKMIALGSPSSDILDQLCRLSEAMVPNSVASIMLLDEQGLHLEVRAAPSIPAAGVAALNGLQPGPQAGSCGTAVFGRKPVYVTNVYEDARWAGLLDFATQFDLHACWSMPIAIWDNEVVGSFALTSFEKRPPDAFHKRLLDTASYLAGIVIERELQSQQLLSANIAFEHMREGVMVTDANYRIIQVNRAFERITGFSAAEAIGQTPKILQSGRQPREFYRDFFRTLERTGEWRGEIWNRRKNGDIYPQWLSVKSVTDADGRAHTHVAVFADITDTKDSEKKLWQMAHYDALSNLPNRLLLNIRLEHAIARAQRAGSQAAVLFIDLDRFKNINDSLGHQAGDELLQVVAQRLRDAVHSDDTVARLGGDEFVILLEDLKDADALRRVAERINKTLSDPIQLRGKSLVATASIGIGRYPDDARDAESLVQHADAAMYRAKTLGRNRIAYYSPTLTAEIQARLELEHDLRQALKNDEFELHYQPQFSAEDGHLVALEALLRWRHPVHGQVSPDRFIPIAEETGLIREIGCWVTEVACAQTMQWHAIAERPFTLAVNLSPYQLQGDCGVRLMEVLSKTGLPPEWFEFEVTETLLVEDGGLALSQLTQMREECGMKIAMDDFGTGHSSLSQLKLLPIGKLKIDRSFIDDLPNDPNDAAIVRAVILMAHTLGLTVVAEGVASIDQHRFLCDADCDHLQGFLYFQPMPAETITQLLKNGELEIPHTCKTRGQE